MEKIYTKITHANHAHLLLLTEVGVMVLLFSLYVYFIIASTFHVALRQEALYAVKDATAKVYALEEAYLTKTSALSIEDAHAVGLVPAGKVAYVSLEGGAHLSKAY